MLPYIKKYTFHIANILFQISLFPVYFLSGFFPRNPKIWVFGSWNSGKFRGNSKYFYLYVKNNYPDIRIAWITKNRNLNSELRKIGVNAYYAYSAGGIFLTLRAKYFVVTHGILDVNEFVSRKGVMINLDHTVYPIKNMRLSIRGSFFKKIALYLSSPYGYMRKPDYAITSSEFTRAATRHHYNITNDKIIPTGSPKTDLLIKNADFDKIRDDSCADFYNTNKKHILFLPTWRGNAQFNLFGHGFDLKTLDDLLKQINGTMFFNFHPLDKSQKVSAIKNSENIKILHYQNDEINILLRRADILITDYSSLFAYFLIYNRPLIFAKFDHEAFLKEKGLFVNYERDLPGPKAEDWPALLRYLREFFVYGRDDYKNMRVELRNKIYPRLDGKARERIMRFILSLDSK